MPAPPAPSQGCTWSLAPGTADAPPPVSVALAPWQLLVSGVLVVPGSEPEGVLRAGTEVKTRSSNEPRQGFAICRPAKQTV